MRHQAKAELVAEQRKVQESEQVQALIRQANINLSAALENQVHEHKARTHACQPPKPPTPKPKPPKLISYWRGTLRVARGYVHANSE
jgi:DNA-binding protein H-NS